MNAHENKTLDILRDIYKRGNSIVSLLNSHDSGERYEATLDAIAWVSEVLVCFENLFYNSIYLDKIKEKIITDDFGNEVYDYVTLKSMLGYIAGIGRMQRFGYLKDQFSGVNNDTSQICFVAMSFAPNREDIFSIGIKPAVESLGYTALRIDTQPHNDKIDSRIIELIMKSRFVVADFTDQRNGVYYEAGFAKGLGLPVIQTCMNEDFNNMHFDVRSINTLHYDTPSKLMPILKKQIAETIGTYKPAANITSIEEINVPF